MYDKKFTYTHKPDISSKFYNAFDIAVRHLRLPLPMETYSDVYLIRTNGGNKWDPDAIRAMTTSLGTSF